MIEKYSLDMLDMLERVAPALETAARLIEDPSERALFRRDALAVRSLVAQVLGEPDPSAKRLEQARKTDEFATFLDGLVKS